MRAQIKQNLNALRRERSDKKKKDMNKRKLSTMKTLVKSAKLSKTTESIQKAQRCIDMTAKTGLIHKNRANRLKVAIYKALNV